MPRNVEDTIGRIGALVDPVRRALYRCVAESPGDVSRDQAARAAGAPPSCTTAPGSNYMSRCPRATMSSPPAYSPVRWWQRHLQLLRACVPPLDVSASVWGATLVVVTADLYVERHRLSGSMLRWRSLAMSRFVRPTAPSASAIARSTH